MKALLRVLLVAMMMLLSVGTVAAQEGGDGEVGTFAWGSGITWTSSMQIQNVDASNDAAVQLCYYSQTDPTNPTCITPSFFSDEDAGVIPAGRSAAVFPAVPSSVASTFNGSVVIQSDTELAAISNIVSSDFKYGASYEGTSAGATKVSLPIIQYNNAGRYYSQFNVQNTGSAQATVTCYFYKEGATTASTSVNLTIEAGAAKTVDPQTLTWFQNNVNTASGGKWVGSVVISSTNGVPVAAVAELLDTGGLSGTGLYAYSGFTGDGADELYLPILMDNNGNYWTGVNVQNVGPGTTDITINYIPESGYATKASQTIEDVAEGGVAVFLQSSSGTKWVGAATVSSSNGAGLQAIVNELNTVTGEGSSYSGFTVASAGDTIYAPLIMQANGGYWTSINIMNISGSNQTVTVNYSPSSGYSAKNSESKSVANNSVGVFLNNGTTKWVGSAIVTVPDGGKLIAIVNEVNSSKTEPAETFLTYNAFSAD